MLDGVLIVAVLLGLISVEDPGICLQLNVAHVWPRAPQQGQGYMESRDLASRLSLCLAGLHDIPSRRELGAELGL
jgi:hypothetical protein